MVQRRPPPGTHTMGGGGGGGGNTGHGTIYAVYTANWVIICYLPPFLQEPQ